MWEIKFLFRKLQKKKSQKAFGNNKVQISSIQQVKCNRK
jgi:hypothetical protein